MTQSSVKKRRKNRTRRSDPQLPFVSTDEFFNRELSWLEFNRRVLSQARNAACPLLERVRFLTICTSNLDEFFMNRVGGLRQKIDAIKAQGLTGLSSDPEHLLKQLRSAVTDLIKTQDQILEHELKPGLLHNGLHVMSWKELSAPEREATVTYFQTNIFPVLTPQAIDPGHPFPAISNLSLSLGILLKHPDRDEELFARLKIPTILPQLFRLEPTPEEHFRAITSLEIIRNNLGALFPGMIIQDILPFRITRNSELDVDEYEADDLVESIAEGLKDRKFAQVVRLEHGPCPNLSILRFLMEEVGILDDDVYLSSSAMEFAALKEIADVGIQHLKFENWTPVSPPQLIDEDANIFSVIRSGDILVHHPYESFNGSVERFLRAAVEDPKVLSIKMTLYRAGDNSSLIPLLIKAAENDKHVVCLIEVKASFDEARNIRHAQLLENAGVHVMYGVVGLKTHAKLILVARQENDTIRCYGHLGTGNYNSTTARFYTDLGLFTCDKPICDDMVELFHFLTGRSLKRNYDQLLVAPVSFKEKLQALIDTEIENHTKGLPAHILIKANSLEDTSTCRALSRAAKAGVPVDLIIRGICCLKPSIQNDTLNPRVTSIVGRFLEHSRLYYFRNGSQDPLGGAMYMSSADPMYRNLHRRVEVAVPIRDIQARLRCWEILTACLYDSVSGWDLQPNGSYVLRKPEDKTVALSSQDLLMKLSKDRARSSARVAT
jgi:polyphosphate kinase